MHRPKADDYGIRYLGVLDCGHTAIKSGWMRVESPANHARRLATLLEPEFAPVPVRAGIRRQDGIPGASDATGLVETLVRRMEDLVRWPGDGENGERRVDGLAAIVPAGVRPGLIRALDQSMILQPVDWCVFSPLDRWPIANAYATPETVGPDRLAAATGAVRRSPTLPLFVITVGTAVTVNLVTPPASESASQEWGEFRGGTILPGYQAFILSLAKAAPTLAPAVQEILRHEDWTRPGFEILHPDLAGATTAGNLRRGALEGVAGAVGQCLTSMEIEQGFPPGSLPVWVTGGDSHALVRGMESMTTLRRQVFIEPNLVLEGMALALDGLMGPPTFPLG